MICFVFSVRAVLVSSYLGMRVTRVNLNMTKYSMFCKEAIFKKKNSVLLILAQILQQCV